MSYVIVVGRERPAEALVSQVKKDGTPVGEDQMKRFIPVGTHMMINQTAVWGRRVIDGKAEKDGKAVELNTVGYNGELEFLPYGDPKGYLITTRFLKQSRSLDVDYQNQIQKLKVDWEKGSNDQSAKLTFEAAMLIFNAGENKYDDKKDSLLIQHLKTHGQNRDSVYKNPAPEIMGFTFYEVTDDNVKTASIDKNEKSINVGVIVMEASNNPNDLQVLLEMVGVRPELEGIDKLSKPKQVYDALLRFAVSNPNDFKSLIDNWKKKFSDAVEKSKSYKALDLTKDGHIALIVDNKPNLIFSDAEGKGDKMIDWVLANCFKSEIYKKATGFISITEKLK